MSARSDERAYDRYLDAMDAAMRQKIAAAAAHLLCVGRVADMGMGSGTGSHALAALYPSLEVIGVDLDPEMVARASDRFDLPNLSFVVGDIGAAVFPDQSLDGIFDSSVLHHVTSFGGYDHQAAVRALQAQVAQLKQGGTLVLRDFVAPEEGGTLVLLDLPSADGEGGRDPEVCSTAALFERFAGEFRSLHPTPGFAYERLDDPRPEWRRYRLAHRHAVEMILRKDYRRDWVSEVREEYLYLSQSQLEETFVALGLRVLASTPIHNPWIVAHRFVGKFELRDIEGRELDFPATNIVIAGEKVGASDGVTFASSTQPASGYLELQGWRDRETGKVFDLVRRPGRPLDVVPYFLDGDGDPQIVARMSYPRPLLLLGGDALDGCRAPCYVTEPIVVLCELGEVAPTLARLAGIDGTLRPERGTTLYPSPGGILEEVRSVHVEIDPLLVGDARGGCSGFASDGRLRAIDARQLLRAAQVGALPDARLELHTHHLLRTLGLDPGPWIGAELELQPSDVPAATSLSLLRARPPRRRFAQTDAPGGFLRVHASAFEEKDSSGRVLATQTLEWVAPITLSTATLSCALLAIHNGEILLGIDDDDRPASQCFDENSQLLVNPAFRVPRDITRLSKARTWLERRLLDDYDLQAHVIAELGGRYHPSPGMTPEVVHPLALWVRRARAHPTLSWVPLRELAQNAASIRDGHLALVVHRAAHALLSE